VVPFRGEEPDSADDDEDTAEHHVLARPAECRVDLPHVRGRDQPPDARLRADRPGAARFSQSVPCFVVLRGELARGWQRSPCTKARPALEPRAASDTAPMITDQPLQASRRRSHSAPYPLQAAVRPDTRRRHQRRGHPAVLPRPRVSTGTPDRQRGWCKPNRQDNRTPLAPRQSLPRRPTPCGNACQILSLDRHPVMIGALASSRM
jgi:hypothetical protein